MGGLPPTEESALVGPAQSVALPCGHPLHVSLERDSIRSVLSEQGAYAQVASPVQSLGEQLVAHHLEGAVRRQAHATHPVAPLHSSRTTHPHWPLPHDVPEPVVSPGVHLLQVGLVGEHLAASRSSVESVEPEVPLCLQSGQIEGHPLALLWTYEVHPQLAMSVAPEHPEFIARVQQVARLFPAADLQETQLLLADDLEVLCVEVLLLSTHLGQDVFSGEEGLETEVQGVDGVALQGRRGAAQGPQRVVSQEEHLVHLIFQYTDTRLQKPIIQMKGECVGKRIQESVSVVRGSQHSLQPGVVEVEKRQNRTQVVTRQLAKKDYVKTHRLVNLREEQQRVLQERQQRKQSYGRQANRHNVLPRQVLQETSFKGRVPARYNKYSIQTMHNKSYTLQDSPSPPPDCSCLSQDTDPSSPSPLHSSRLRDQAVFSYSSISDLSCCQAKVQQPVRRPRKASGKAKEVKVVPLETLQRMKRVDALIKENLKRQSLLKSSQQRVQQNLQEEKEAKQLNLQRLKEWQNEQRKSVEPKQTKNKYGWWVDQRRMEAKKKKGGSSERRRFKCQSKSQSVVAQIFSDVAQQASLNIARRRQLSRTKKATTQKSLSRADKSRDSKPPLDTQHYTRQVLQARLQAQLKQQKTLALQKDSQKQALRERLLQLKKSQQECLRKTKRKAFDKEQAKKEWQKMNEVRSEEQQEQLTQHSHEQYSQDTFLETQQQKESKERVQVSRKTQRLSLNGQIKKELLRKQRDSAKNNKSLSMQKHTVKKQKGCYKSFNTKQKQPEEQEGGEQDFVIDYDKFQHINIPISNEPTEEEQPSQEQKQANKASKTKKNKNQVGDCYKSGGKVVKTLQKRIEQQKSQAHQEHCQLYRQEHIKEVVEKLKLDTVTDSDSDIDLQGIYAANQEQQGKAHRKPKGKEEKFDYALLRKNMQNIQRQFQAGLE